MTVLSTENGIKPYPRLTGAPGRQVVLTPQEGSSKMKCSICGLGQDENPAHAADYSGPGQHKFKPAGSAKSINELLTEDSLVNFGDAIKALGEGKIAGWAVLFTKSDEPDLTGDFFDSNTDYFFEGETKAIRPLLYDHGLNDTIKSRKLGKANLEIKDAGIWFDSQLDLSNKYDKAIYKLAEQGKLGTSTGSAPHLIQRESVGKSAYIKSWPIVELSVTPKPIEPKTKGQVITLKSIINGEIEFDEDGFDELLIHNLSRKSTTRSFKGIFEQELAEKGTSFYDLQRVLCDVMRDIAAAADTVDISGGSVDLRAKVTEAVTEMAARLIPLLVGQIQDWLDLGGTDSSNSLSPSGTFYVKSFQKDNALQLFLSTKALLETDSNLGEHSSAVVSALDEYASIGESMAAGVKSWSERLEEKIQFRDGTKSGRTISAATATKLAEARAKLKPILEHLAATEQHLTDLEGMSTPSGKSAIDLTGILTVMLAEHQNAMAGIPVPAS